MIQINHSDPFTLLSWEHHDRMDFGWIIVGVYTNKGESPIEKRLFIRGCEIIVCIQIAMTVLLFLNMYTHVTQWVVWSIPWLFGVVDWISNKQHRQTSSFSWHHADPNVHWTWIHLARYSATVDARLTHLPLGTRKTICTCRNVCRDRSSCVLVFPTRMAVYFNSSPQSNNGNALLNPRYLSVGICLVNSNRTLRMDQRIWC